jgi:surfeit locus 1 family protein
LKETRPRGLGGLILPAVLTLAAVAILVSLGNWQVRRLAWKEDLIAAATERPHEAVRDLPTPSTWGTLDPAGGDGYRPFRLTGRFLHDKEVRVFTSIPDPRGSYGGPGYWIVTPFALADGGTVLVNRGFAPEEKSLPGARGETLVSDPVTVTGLMRPDETRSYFTPDDRPDQNMFFARNVAAISAARNLSPPVAPFTIDLVASETPAGGLPQAGETRISFPNNHLQYALTWYGLAAALLAVFGTFAWRRLNERRDARLTPPRRVH